MPNGMVSIDRDIQTSRRLETVGTSSQELTTPGVGSLNIVRRGILDLVLRSGVALRREEEDVFAIQLRQRWSFDVCAVLIAVSQDCDWIADLRDSVLADLLEHQGRRDDWCNGVTAFASVANGVAVDFVRDPSRAVLGIKVSGGIDGATFRQWADERLRARVDVRSGDISALCVTETVESGVGLQGSGVIHDERSIVELDWIWRPHTRIGGIYPARQVGKCVVTGGELPVPVVRRESLLHMDSFPIDNGVGAECMPAGIGFY